MATVLLGGAVLFGRHMVPDASRHPALTYAVGPVTAFMLGQSVGTLASLTGLPPVLDPRPRREIRSALESLDSNVAAAARVVMLRLKAPFAPGFWR